MLLLFLKGFKINNCGCDEPVFLPLQLLPASCVLWLGGGILLNCAGMELCSEVVLHVEHTVIISPLSFFLLASYFHFFNLPMIIDVLLLR